MNNYLAQVNIKDNFSPATKFGNIPDVISALLPNIFLLAGIIFTVVFIYTGFRLMKGGENPDELVKIRTMLITSGVGMAIIFGSYFIMKIIGTLLNITLPF